MPASTVPDQQAAIAVRVKGCCEPVAESLPETTAAQIASVFKAISDPTRVQMLHMLKAADQPVCVCDFTAAFEQGQPTVSHHLARLRDAGFVTSHKRGIWAFYELRSDMPAGCSSVLNLIP